MSGIAVVGYGMGNVGSIANMLKKLGVAATVSGDPDVVAAADQLILPGVGAFDAAMARLHDLGLVDVLQERVIARGVPVLGICLGMQLFADGSDEGIAAGLRWIPGRVRRLEADPAARLRVPHMGWNTVTPRRDAPLPTLGGDSRYYFVHSYAFDCADDAHVLGVTHHGAPFVSAVARDNVWGVQFHPEKSHRHGMALLADFAKATTGVAA